MTVEAVNVLIADSTKNKVLCVQRSLEDPNFGGMWALPGGGIERGETHHETAKREL